MSFTRKMHNADVFWVDVIVSLRTSLIKNLAMAWEDLEKVAYLRHVTSFWSSV